MSATRESGGVDRVAILVLVGLAAVAAVWVAIGWIIAVGKAGVAERRETVTPTYYKDHRTELCFAGGASMTLTNVPCTDKVLELIEHQETR